MGKENLSDIRDSQLGEPLGNKMTTIEEQGFGAA